MKKNNLLILVLVIFFFGIVGGTFIYQNVEGWSFLDALYFVIVTVTTIGYGDISPHTPAGKIFTMFFAFFGVATALYIFSHVSSSLFKKHINSKMSQIKRDVKKEGEIKEEIKKDIKEGVKKAGEKNKKFNK